MMVTIENLKVFFAKIKTIFATKDELNSGLNTKANKSHGNHVPTTGSADNTMFLRNDNTWQKVTPSNIGAAPTSHGTHVTYSTTAPAAPGTASAGTASTVARTDHVHPAQTTVSGNAGTATKLKTARTINGVSFDGTSNITITAAANGGTSAACSGNAATATKLQTARTINGTSFDGTTAITTANWGTARTLTVGNTGKSVNGSGNVSWSLAEIGAAPTSHGTHVTYSTTAPAAPGTASAGTASTVARTDHVHPAQTTVSGNAGTATKLQTARTINGVSFDGTSNITITAAANGGTSAACSGNAGTATKLQTARTLTVGNTGKTFDGSANISWSLTEIGAAPTSHGTHVTYSTTAPAAPGTASAGTASTVARTDHVHPAQTTVSGNAGTATKLQTARTINGTSFDGTAAITTANWGTARTLTVGNTGKSVNGSGNVSWSLAEIGALPLAGGTLTGAIAFSNSGTTTRGITGTVGDNDYWRVVGGATASDAGFMEIATANDGNEPIYVRQYTGVFATVKRTVTLLDGNGNTTFPGKVNTDSIGVKKCSLQYNTTTESLDFIFA